MIDLEITATDPTLAPGQYRYQHTTAWWSSSFGRAGRRYSYLAEHVLELWVPADPDDDWLLERSTTGRRRWLRGNAEDASRDGFDLRDRWPVGRWRCPGGDFYGSRADHGSIEGSWQTPTADFLAALSRDPRELYRALDAASPPSAAGYDGVVTYALDSVRSGLVPADLRIALYAALTLVPDMRVIRQGGVVSLVFSDRVAVTELLVDEASGSYLGERRTIASSSPTGLEPGTVVKSVVVSHAVVGEIGARPDRTPTSTAD